MLSLSASAQAADSRCPQNTHYVYALLSYSNCVEGFGIDQVIIDGGREEGPNYCLLNVKAAGNGEQSGKDYLGSLVENTGGYVGFCATVDASKRNVYFSRWAK
ncbi:MAG TPA: hypothetical protein VIH99_10890 [Bdellovibrionota bacterium]